MTAISKLNHLKERLLEGNFHYFGNWTSLLSSIFAVIASVLVILTSSLILGVLSLSFPLLSLFIELPVFESMCPKQLKENKGRIVSYAILSILYFIFQGLFYSIAGTCSVLSCILYAIAEYKHQTTGDTVQLP